MSKPPLDRWALSRALTRMANASPQELLQMVVTEPPRQFARRIGITGAPGSGKSTLTGHLALDRLARNGRLGILAIDPSSPRSGGAILGDRVRMDDLAGSDQLYIRSLGSRRTSDGLADNLPEMLDLMDHFGFDEVLLETVGVGQAEYAVRSQVDTLVLTLLPESGDIVQAMKAGIMEMADIYVVNKADLPGARRMVADLRRLAAMVRPSPQAWVTPILAVSSMQPETIRALSQAIDDHLAWQTARVSGNDDRPLQRARYRLKRWMDLQIADVIAQLGDDLYCLPVPQQAIKVLEKIQSRLEIPDKSNA